MNDLKDVAQRWSEFQPEQPSVRFPFFLQVLCTPMIGIKLDDAVSMELRITAKVIKPALHLTLDNYKNHHAMHALVESLISL